jgi:hypothetical protein
MTRGETAARDREATPISAADQIELLRLYRPYLSYANAEAFWADSCEMIFHRIGSRDAPDRTPNVLRRGDALRRGDSIIASSESVSAQTALTRRFLDVKTYGNGDAVEDGDTIDLGGGRGLSSDEYSADAHFRRTLGDSADRVVGRFVIDVPFAWLQYWLFYYYNDKGGVVGRHECDWELVQVGLDPTSREPRVVTFSQHGHPDARDWGDGFEPEAQYGVVSYVAYKSHANYFAPGSYTIRELPGPARVADHAPGDYEELIRPEVEVVDDSVGWAGWPGRWGADTAPVGGPFRAAGNSPAAPCEQEAWRAPTRFHRGKALEKSGVEAQGLEEQPVITAVERDRRKLALDVRFPLPEARARLVPETREDASFEGTVAVRDPGVIGPARSYTRTLQSSDERLGVELPGELEGRPVEVQVTVTAPDGSVSFSEIRDVDPDGGG